MAHSIHDLLERLKQRNRCLEQRVLQRSHALEHISRAVRDHVSREKDTRIHTLRVFDRSINAVTKCGGEVHTLQTCLGKCDDLLVAQKDNQIIEAVPPTKSYQKLC